MANFCDAVRKAMGRTKVPTVFLGLLLAWFATSVNCSKGTPKDKNYQQVALLAMQAQAEKCGYILTDDDRKRLKKEV